jgi:hypothetical protein
MNFTIVLSFAPNNVFQYIADILSVGVSWIDAEAASKLPNTTTSLPNDPDRYIVELDVFHQLHCLNSVRKAMYRDRYKNDWTDFYSNGVVNYTSVDANHIGMQSPY